MGRPRWLCSRWFQWSLWQRLWRFWLCRMVIRRIDRSPCRWFIWYGWWWSLGGRWAGSPWWWRRGCRARVEILCLITDDIYPLNEKREARILDFRSQSDLAEFRNLKSFPPGQPEVMRISPQGLTRCVAPQHQQHRQRNIHSNNHLLPVCFRLEKLEYRVDLFGLHHKTQHQ